RRLVPGQLDFARSAQPSPRRRAAQLELPRSRSAAASTYTHVRLGLRPSSGLVWLAIWPGTLRCTVASHQFSLETHYAVRGPSESRGLAGRRLPRDARAPLRLEAGFEETCGALASADAHRHDAVLRLAAEHLIGDGADHARAGHPERMADGDRAAVRIELVHGDAELVAAVDHLRGEGLVQLPHADVLELDAGPLEQLRNRVHGPDAHLVGLAAGYGEAAEDQLGLDSERL